MPNVVVEDLLLSRIPNKSKIDLSLGSPFKSDHKKYRGSAFKITSYWMFRHSFLLTQNYLIHVLHHFIDTLWSLGTNLHNKKYIVTHSHLSLVLTVFKLILYSLNSCQYITFKIQSYYWWSIPSFKSDHTSIGDGFIYPLNFILTCLLNLKRLFCSSMLWRFWPSCCNLESHLIKVHIVNEKSPIIQRNLCSSWSCVN